LFRRLPASWLRPLPLTSVGLRPVIFPPDEIIRVVVWTPARLFTDGDYISELPPHTEIIVSQAKIPTYLNSTS